MTGPAAGPGQVAVRAVRGAVDAVPAFGVDSGAGCAAVDARGPAITTAGDVNLGRHHTTPDVSPDPRGSRPAANCAKRSYLSAPRSSSTALPVRPAARAQRAAQRSRSAPWLNKQNEEIAELLVAVVVVQ